MEMKEINWSESDYTNPVNEPHPHPTPTFINVVQVHSKYNIGKDLLQRGVSLHHAVDQVHNRGIYILFF